VSVLEVTFPDEWRALPSRAVAGAPNPGSASAHRGGPVTADLLPALDFDNLASLALLDAPSGEGIQALCAIGVVHHCTGTDGELRAIAESSPHPGLERDTLTVEFSLGRAARSSAFRFAEELLDDPRIAPFAAEIRFALPLPGRRIGILHFETPSLRCFEELETLFDTIAGTARVA
jgi:hypothetical protein